MTKSSMSRHWTYSHPAVWELKSGSEQSQTFPSFPPLPLRNSFRAPARLTAQPHCIMHGGIGHCSPHQTPFSFLLLQLSQLTPSLPQGVINKRFHWPTLNCAQTVSSDGLSFFSSRKLEFLKHFAGWWLHRIIAPQHFLAAQSSSRSLVVGPLVGPSVGWSPYLWEKVTFRVSHGNLNLPTYLPMW